MWRCGERGMVSNYFVEKNYANVFSNFHEYLMNAYQTLMEANQGKGIDSFPTIEEVTEEAYDELHQYIVSSLVSVEKERLHDYKFTESVEMYSYFFDFYAPSEEVQKAKLFSRICDDVKNYFALYRLTYRENNELVHGAICEVW